MKILLTGANGLLGQKIVAQAVRSDSFELLATGRGSCRYDDSVPYREMDICNGDSIHDVVTDFQPDAIIHAAAMTDVDACELNHEQCLEVNVEATRKLVRAAEAINAHFVLVSTDFIFSGDAGPLPEEATPAPVNFYGESKLKAEEIVIASSVRWSIARTVLVYGVVKDMSRSNIILWVKKSLEEGTQIRVVDDQYRTPTLAEDLADGCLRIALQGKTGVYNISGTDFLTPYEMAMMTADYFGLDSQLIERTDSTIFKQPARRPPRTGFVIDKAIEQLGYRPHTFMEGIKLVASQVDSNRG